MAPDQDDSAGSFEKQLDITIVSATVTSLASLNAGIYVVVALGDGTQKVDGAQLVSPDTEHTTVTWNKTLHFAFEVSQANNATDFAVSLYQKHEGDDILLGQTIEDLSRTDKDTDVTRQFLASGSSITFRIGKGRIFALIIGINEYLEQSENLYGCVTDALDMEDFLRNGLKVPGENLRVLHNQDATRQNILDGIQTHLLENTNISYGDTMIIFYAGHGGQNKAPTGWISSDGMIEEMCPHDQNGRDRDGNQICGIPDRTINALVRRIAEAKGNNIVLIFDSCHSGGIARSNEEKDDMQCRVRSFRNPCPLDPSVDIAIWGESSRGAYQVLPTGFSHKDMASHVLLAACEPNQLSHESTGNNPRGWFSSHLIPILRKSHLQSMPLSYLEVINQIPRMPSQTQQCLGKNKDCIMFTLGMPTKKSKLHFELKSTADGFEVELGSMHGVVVGTEFSVVKGPGRERIGLLVATKVFPQRSTLVPAENTRMNVPPGAEALIWNWNNVSLTLNVLTNCEKVQNYVLSAKGLHTGYNIRLADSEFDAHVSLCWNDNGKKYEVKRLPSFLTDHPDIKGECKGAADNLFDILTAICHFHYHLQHSKMTKSDIQVGTSLSVGASVEIHLLPLTHSLESGSPDFPTLVPMSSQNLFDSQCSANLSRETPEQSYGIKIVNKSTTALFVYLFYFNPADYSIQEWFHPPSNTMNPPLKPGNSLTIGYGANGAEPFCFDLDEGEKEGTGFLKLFVSSTYTDMTYLTQHTPFTSQQHPRAEPMKGIKNVTGSLVVKITVVS